MIYSFSHFLFHEAVKEIVDHVEDGRGSNVVHTFWADGRGILVNNSFHQIIGQTIDLLWHLETGHQFFHQGKWSRSDVAHGEAFQVDENDHSSDEELLVFITQHLRNHETNSLDILKLFQIGDMF